MKIHIFFCLLITHTLAASQIGYGVVYEDCTNIDTVEDSQGNICSIYYDAFYPGNYGEQEGECGKYDTHEFKASELCCICAPDY